MDALDLDNPAWRFALDLYGRPDVAGECLRLQDEHGLDVSLLLVSLWLGSERRAALDPGRLGDAQAIARDWAGIAVAPLRAARRGVKLSPAIRDPAVVSFRAKLQSVEIEAERIEMALLYRWAAGRDWPDPSTDGAGPALQNLGLVLATYGAASGDLPSALVRALSTLEAGGAEGRSDQQGKAP